MIVIADTTPLNYLILTDLIHIVSALFGQVITETHRSSRSTKIDRRANGRSTVTTETSFRVSPRLLNTLLDRYKS